MKSPRPAKPAPKMLVTQIRQDGGTQSRASVHDDVVAEYAEAYRTGAIMPPVTLFYDGTDHWLADGFHRVAGAERARVARIPAEIQQGSLRAAILHSVKANATHGLRRSNADKRRAVTMLLKDEEWGAKSDRWIADSCDVSAPFVAELRAAVQLKEFTAAPRQGQDGKSYPGAKAKAAPPEKDSLEPLSNAPAISTDGPPAGGGSGDDEGTGANDGGSSSPTRAPAPGESPAGLHGCGGTMEECDRIGCQGVLDRIAAEEAAGRAPALPPDVMRASEYLTKAAQLIAQAQGYLTRIESEVLPYDPAVLQRLQQAAKHAAGAIRQATPAMVCPWCKDPSGEAGRREHCTGCMQAGYLRQEQVGGVPASLMVPGMVHNGSGGVCASEDWTPPAVVKKAAWSAALANTQKKPEPRVSVLLADEAGNETPFEPLDDTEAS